MRPYTGIATALRPRNDKSVSCITEVLLYQNGPGSFVKFTPFRMLISTSIPQPFSGDFYDLSKKLTSPSIHSARISLEQSAS
jgi:hypothetical protein